MNDLFELGLDANSLGRLSYTAENDFVGAPTGMMDQLASLRCTAGHALFLDNRTLDAEQVPLDPVADGLRLLVLDTRVHHGNADGAYGNRREPARRAAGCSASTHCATSTSPGSTTPSTGSATTSCAAVPVTSCSRTRESSTPSAHCETPTGRRSAR